jgi:hypothetical protein
VRHGGQSIHRGRVGRAARSYRLCLRSASRTTVACWVSCAAQCVHRAWLSCSWLGSSPSRDLAPVTSACAFPLSRRALLICRRMGRFEFGRTSAERKSSSSTSRPSAVRSPVTPLLTACTRRMCVRCSPRRRAMRSCWVLVAGGGGRAAPHPPLLLRRMRAVEGEAALRGGCRGDVMSLWTQNGGGVLSLLRNILTYCTPTIHPLPEPLQSAR